MGVSIRSLEFGVWSLESGVWSEVWRGCGVSYVSIEAPSSLSSPGALCASNLIEMYLPKRELLWLRWVFALPSAW